MNNKSDKIVVFDSVEKTAGSSIKHLLRKNFKEECFFDYDNGDPPDVSWRNYGIKCTVEGAPGSQEFFDNRGSWLAENHKNYDLQCVYGHGLFLGRRSIIDLLSDSPKELILARFLREPAERIVSEYYYVLTNEEHPLHRDAVLSGSLEGWFESTNRPKNRQARGILGTKRITSGASAFDLLMNNYAYFGLVEYMHESIYLLCNKLNLKNIVFPHLNSTKGKRLQKNFKSIARENFYHFDEHDYELYDKAAPYFLIDCKEELLSAG